MRLTELVHQKLKHTLQIGDMAIDATTGNGHDTLLLAQCVGETGKLFAFDVQEQALETAKRHLQTHGIQTPITWLCTSHEHLLKSIPKQYHQDIQAITFNLGYLPHSDKSITTHTDTTLIALDAAMQLLGNGGILSILAYTAHEGGREECEAVKAWVNTLPNHYHVSLHIPENTRISPPEWICVQKQLI